MKEVETAQADYRDLNRGAEDGALSLGFTDFTMRAMNLWFAGKDSHGKRGIVPATFSLEEPTLSLEFWLVRPSGRKRFQCWLMNKLARAAHVALFLELYPDGKCDIQSDSGDSVEAGAGLTMASPCKEVLSRKEAESPEKEVVISVASTICKKKKAKKKKRSDMFNPLDGFCH
jgi:hypothetical protein